MSSTFSCSSAVDRVLSVADFDFLNDIFFLQITMKLKHPERVIKEQKKISLPDNWHEYIIEVLQENCC